MKSIAQRIKELERQATASDLAFKGMVDVARGEEPIDALRRAPEPGLWLLIDNNDGGHLGEMSRDGVARIIADHSSC